MRLLLLLHVCICTYSIYFNFYFNCLSYYVYNCTCIVSEAMFRLQFGQVLLKFCCSLGGSSQAEPTTLSIRACQSCLTIAAFVESSKNEYCRFTCCDS